MKYFYKLSLLTLSFVLLAPSASALGAVLPPDCPRHNLFRLPNRTMVCKESRGKKAFIPRRTNRGTEFIKKQNRSYTKQRATIKKVKPFANSRYQKRVRRSKRAIMAAHRHVLRDRDVEAQKARRKAVQSAYHKTRFR